MTRRTTRNKLLSIARKIEAKKNGGESEWLRKRQHHRTPTLPADWDEYLRRVEKGNPELVPELKKLIQQATGERLG